MFKTSLSIIFCGMAVASLWSCKGESDLDSETFLTYENKSAAFIRENARVPLGDDCKSVYYYFRSGGLQDLTMLSKFSCDKNKVEDVIAILTKWNDEQIGKRGNRQISLIAPYDLNILPSAEIKKLSWWDLKKQKIERAIICKEGFGCNFWITESKKDSRVIVYMYQSP